MVKYFSDIIIQVGDWAERPKLYRLDPFLRDFVLFSFPRQYLPSGFAEKYLSGISGFIKIQLGEKQWPVRCLYKAGRAKFSQGWYEFTLENNIGEGDVCVFELLRTRDFILKVTAFRVNQYV